MTSIYSECSEHLSSKVLDSLCHKQHQKKYGLHFQETRVQQEGKYKENLIMTFSIKYGFIEVFDRIHVTSDTLSMALTFP